MYEGPLVYDRGTKKWCINDVKNGKYELMSGQRVYLRFGSLWLEGMIELGRRIMFFSMDDPEKFDKIIIPSQGAILRRK